MKVRIKGNSLRLRISRSEVGRLLARDCLEETIRFAPEVTAKFTYALRMEPSLSMLSVQYTEGRVAILLPADQANEWGLTERVGIAESISLGAPGLLVVLIEKDFACLDGSDEDNQDTFANPNAGKTC